MGKEKKKRKKRKRKKERKKEEERDIKDQYGSQITRYIYITSVGIAEWTGPPESTYALPARWNGTLRVANILFSAARIRTCRVRIPKSIFHSNAARIGNSSTTPFIHAGSDACMRSHFDFSLLEWRNIHAKQIARTCNDSTCADRGNAGGSNELWYNLSYLCVHPVMESFSLWQDIYLTLADVSVCGFTYASCHL